MAYDIHRADGALLVRWTATPTRAAVESLRREFEAARRAAGSQLAFWIVIPADDVDLPPADARAAFQESARGIFDQCASIDLVLLGESVRVSLMRAALRAMAVVTRTGDRVSVHGSVEAAITARRPPSAIAAQLRA